MSACLSEVDNISPTSFNIRFLKLVACTVAVTAFEAYVLIQYNTDRAFPSFRFFLAFRLVRVFWVAGCWQNGRVHGARKCRNERQGFAQGCAITSPRPRLCRWVIVHGSINMFVPCSLLRFKCTSTLRRGEPRPKDN